jgi:excisionase family DNA binding protein
MNNSLNEEHSSDHQSPRARNSNRAEPQYENARHANEPFPRLCVSVREAAVMLNVGPVSVYRLLQRGLLKSSRAFRHKLIPVSEIQRFLDATTI